MQARSSVPIAVVVPLLESASTQIRRKTATASTQKPRPCFRPPDRMERAALVAHLGFLDWVSNFYWLRSISRRLVGYFCDGLPTCSYPTRPHSHTLYACTPRIHNCTQAMMPPPSPRPRRTPQE